MLRIAALLFLLSCMFLVSAPLSAARAPATSNMDLMSINLSHPFIFSITSGTLTNNLVTEMELGLGGGKFGVGLGAMEQNSFLAVKAVIMYKWEEPFGDQSDMGDIIDQVEFPNDKWYYGAEAVLSNQGYRLAVAAYKIYDPDTGDTEDTLYGASIGLGF